MSTATATPDTTWTPLDHLEDRAIAGGFDIPGWTEEAMAECAAEYATATLWPAPHPDALPANPLDTETTEAPF